MVATSHALGRLVRGFRLVALCAATWAAPDLGFAAQPPSVRLSGQIPASAVAAATRIGPLAGDTTLSLAFALPLHNQGELDDLLRRLYDPADPLYGQYLTPEEFTARFGPSQADYDALISFARSKGMTVTGTHPNRLLLDVSAPARAIEAAFNPHLSSYRGPNGREFHASDRNPYVPAALASVIQGVIGLDNAAVWRPHSKGIMVSGNGLPAPSQIGTGSGGGLAPSDIRTAYGLDSVSQDGNGQTLGLFELAGYSATDITAYEDYFSLLPHVPLQNVLVDGVNGKSNSHGGGAEVTLDIELMIALAPGASEILVYEGPNNNTGVVDTYNRIATDDQATQISTSWGLSETQSTMSVLRAENNAFQQMATQGQSIYAASGDSGAYDDGQTLSVDDPASQPYMVGVGGTTLSVVQPSFNENYESETTWNSGSTLLGASGGGISAVWLIPSWQQGAVVSAASEGSQSSQTYRNVPDVSLDAYPNTGYAIYYRNNWYIYGGTSCATPLWAAFTALVNEQRAANGNGLLGFANPAIYQIATGGNCTADFHDTADGSNNLYYPAVAGYDDATGWGSFNGAYLLADLAAASSAPPAPTNLTAAAGNASVALSWGASSEATSYVLYRGTSWGPKPKMSPSPAQPTQTAV